MSLPLQEQMNMADPEEHLLWALVGMAAEAGAPLIVPTQILRGWSKHLYECGFRHHPEEQQRWYHPPKTGDSIMEAGLGEWSTTPPSSGPVDEIIQALPAEVIERIRQGGAE